MKRRVVLTGIGAVTPIGVGVTGLWCGVRRGMSVVRRLTRFDPTPFRSQLAAEVDDFQPTDWMTARTVRRLDRFAQFGVAAARQAIEDACLLRKPFDRTRAGVSLGTALGGIAFGENQHTMYLQKGLRSVSPALALAVYGGASGANIAIDLDFQGPNLANTNSCASGAVAVGEAMRMIERGDADVMIAGGAETPLAPLTFGSFSIIKAMSVRNFDPTHSSRPFDRGRDGFVMAEGAAVMVLEEESHARQRGARTYAEVAGYAQSNDAFHMTAPRPDGRSAAIAIRGALKDAGIAPESLDYINAHATSTPLGDAAEARAFAQSLGSHSNRVPVSGTKGLCGHALGASGAIEVAITALAIKDRFIPGTTNLESPESEVQLNLVGPQGAGCDIGYALTTSFGFGGVNAALILGRSGQD